MALVAGLLGCVCGCQQEVYHGLTERQANEMVVALEQEGVRADKMRDGGEENRWAVTVPSGQKVRAWKLLEAKGLPEPETEGFGNFYPTGGLIPTASEERILYQYATAQELRKTILKIKGVVDAQVNLVLPEKPRVQLAHTEIEPPRASVLVKYRPLNGNDEAALPFERAEIERLVAGGVERLERERVEVVATPARLRTSQFEDPELSQVGPVSVAPRSKSVLQTVVGAMGAIIVVLGGGVVFLLWRRFRDQEA